VRERQLHAQQRVVALRIPAIRVSPAVASRSRSQERGSSEGKSAALNRRGLGIPKPHGQTPSISSNRVARRRASRLTLPAASWR
jgi:hypothetical protein